MKTCYDHPERVKGFFVYNDDLDACPCPIHTIRGRHQYCKENLITMTGAEQEQVTNTLIGLIDQLVAQSNLCSGPCGRGNDLLDRVRTVVG